MLFEFLLSVFDSDCAVFVNGDGHAVLDIVEELLAKAVDCGHRAVRPDCGFLLRFVQTGRCLLIQGKDGPGHRRLFLRHEGKMDFG